MSRPFQRVNKLGFCPRGPYLLPVAHRLRGVLTLALDNIDISFVGTIITLAVNHH